MRLKPAPSPAAAFAVAGLILAGWAGSVGLAGADPEPARLRAIDSDGTYAVVTSLRHVQLRRPGRRRHTAIGSSGWLDGALIDNALSKKPQVVTIEPTDKAFKTHGCQPWQNTGSEERCPCQVLDLKRGPTTKSARHPQRLTRTDWRGECLSPN